jgi:hypothetical protein
MTPVPGVSPDPPDPPTSPDPPDGASPRTVQARRRRERPSGQRWWRRWWAAAALLLVAYLGLSLLNDPRASLGTDTGGKAATVKVMSERGDFVPDVGYWASDLDDPPRWHGLIYTVRYGDRFVQVTTLPMVLAARPLWDVAGYRGALVLPMLGGVAVALAARAMAQRLGDRDGLVAFWVVGLASPVALYALDLWEHSPGLALMGWGVVALWDVAEARRPVWLATLGGLCFGAAFSMRTEAAVYGVVALGVTAAVLTWRRHVGSALLAGVLGGAGALAAVAANQALEVAVLGQSLRSGRAVGTAAAGGQDLALRFEEALLTGVALLPARDPTSLTLSALAAASLVGTAVLAARRRTPGAVALGVVAVAVYLLRAAEGLGFVPGLVATTPFAAAGLALGWRPSARLVLAYGLVPVPLVIAFQYTGGALPQWGGRYLLLSGLLLGVVGVAERGRMPAWARRGFVGLAVGVTAFGLAWFSARTHQVAAAGERLEALGEPLLIAENGFLPREFGATYPGQQWWAVSRRADLPAALALVDRAPVDRFGLVLADADGESPALPGWRRTGTDRVPFVGGVDLAVARYEREVTAGR